MNRQNEATDRRSFLRSVGGLGAGLALAGPTRGWAESSAKGQRTDQPVPLTCKPIETVRIGFVGVGSRGGSILRELLRMKGCRIDAICDIIPNRVAESQGAAVAAGFPKPAGYDRGPEDYRRLCQQDLDLVITATPWILHTPVCVAALEAGKHAATEVPACMTLNECWQLVEASEKARRHCAILENYCYNRDTMCILNMVRQGLFGDPMHVYAGYQKDSMYYSVNTRGELTDAGKEHVKSMGNCYPTHHVGPPAQWMDVNRGDAFDYLVSMGNSGEAYNQFVAEIYGKDHPLARQKFDMTDVSNTLIRTKKGRSIHLNLDTVSPRPHRNYFQLMATRGFYDNIERKVIVLGRTPGARNPTGHAEYSLVPLDRHFYKDYDHPIWKDLEKQTSASGHGGTDYLCFFRLVEALRTGTYPDIDVYDTAAWSSIVELSEISARNRSKPMDFPDFTRGAWQTRKPLPIGGA